MNTSVSALHGAMGPLIWKLKVLLLEASDGDLKRWPRLPMGVKDGIDLLKEELEEISASLEDLSELEDPPLTAKCWMKEVRELSYDIEDYIDNFARPSCRTRTRVKTRSVYKVSHVQLNRFPRRKALIWHKEVRIKISEFRIRVQEANERHKRYELDCLDNFRRRYASSGPMLPWIYDEAADLVIDGQMSEFIDILACNIDHQLRVIPIIGPGGLGKTTIARVVYNNIRGQFDCRAFVSMTRKPNIRNILHDILAQVQRHQKRDDCEDLDIMGRIRKHLHGKRYLIVIDYLWDASTWNIISCAFPESSQRSRIIITTQVEDVALTCCRYQPEFVFEMKPLDVYHTRKLFFNIIFGSKSICPVIFKEVLYKILGMCGGSPLATANMASLLARCPLTLMEQLAYIRDSLGITLQRNSTTEGIRQVLNLSYNNLNPCLKSCLLYLHIYPEGSIIYSDDLVKQWVAEGFIDAVEGRDIESVARSYFFELIGRRFIQPIYIKYNDDIVSCTVHDTVYDLIAYNSREENFVTVVDADRKNVELSDKVRRLSLNFSDAMYAKLPKYIQPSYIQSLAFFGFFACLPSMTEFKLLRVLHLQLSCHCGDDILNLNWISELYQLRYLKVISDVFIKLPKNMRGLHHLVTLNIDAKVTTFPCDIIHLPNLLHLCLSFDANMMDWINSMGSDVVRRLDKLTNLRDLHLTSSTVPPNNLEKNMEGLASLIGGLGNLEILVLVPGTSHINTMVHNPPEAVVSWDGFALPLHLKRFEWSQCKYIFSRVPKWIVKSSNLCVLKIMVKELLRADVDILKGLPVLTTLSLYVHSAPLERIVFDKMGFSSLKFFKFRCSVPPWLKFEADAMQNLMKLKLGFNANREDLHHSIQHVVIGHLPCLKQIYVKIGGAGVDAKSALTASVFNHPSNPNINTELVDWVFFGYQGRDRAPEDKDRQDNLVVKEMREEVSWEDTKKQVDLRISTSTESPSCLPISASLSTSVGYRLPDDSARGVVVRHVRCRRCHILLREPAGAPVYKCGGCGTTLRGKAGLIRRFRPRPLKSQEASDGLTLKDFSATNAGGESFWPDQFFSICNFAPTWTYAGSKTKILVNGRILNTTQVTERYKWSCMFGEVGVRAQMLADGTLLCYSPPHKPGRVPFYITCSNRLACSEVREFEFRPNDSQYMDAPSPHGATNKVYFQIRLDKLVSLGPDEYQAIISNPSVDMIDLSKKISSLILNKDEWSKLLKLADDNGLSTDDQMDQFAENLIKVKLHVWLLQRVGVGGKGPSVLDDEGQGVLHLAAALGYNWAIRPTVSAGVNINFRDVHGWTPLHWAAFCATERTVVALIDLGAAPGALADPTPDFPFGSTPADLASANGHKNISRFLNSAAQAAARIYQVFRVQSFQRKQAAQFEDGKGEISDEHALSLLSVKPSKPGQDPLHAAATHIQNKFRGWKGRKEFLLIRQRIVKIQAHVRGHQVRKIYAERNLSVGKWEKVVTRPSYLRVLRGFGSESGAEDTSGGRSSIFFLEPLTYKYSGRSSIFMDKECVDPVPYRGRLREEGRQTAIAQPPCYKLPPPVAEPTENASSPS